VLRHGGSGVAEYGDSEIGFRPTDQSLIHIRYRDFDSGFSTTRALLAGEGAPIEKPESISRLFGDVYC
jgi:hypothetical protein